MKLGFEARNSPILLNEDWEKIDALNSTVVKFRSYHCIPENISKAVDRNLSVILRPSSDGDMNAADRYFEMGESITKLLDADVQEILLLPDSEPNLHGRPMPPDYWNQIATFFVLVDKQFGEHNRSGRLKYGTPPMALAQGEEAWLSAATVTRMQGMNEGGTENLLTGFDFYTLHAYGQTDESLVDHAIALAQKYAPGIPIVAAEVGDSSNADPSTKAEATIRYLQKIQQAGASAACLFIVGSHDPQWSGFVLPIDQIRRIAASAPVTPPVSETPAPVPTMAETVLSLYPVPVGPVAKPLVWKQWERVVTEAATLQSHLSPDDLVRVALGPLATLDQESSGNPKVNGDRRADGYYCSRGLFQLNTCGGKGSTMLREHGITADDLYDLKWQYLHAQDLLLATEAELYWSRQEARQFWPGRAIQSVQRSSSDPRGVGYQAAYRRLAGELGIEVDTMGSTVRIGNLDVVDLSARYPSTYASRELSQITNISVHHSATPTLPESATEAEEIAALDSIHAYHLKEFKGISYHATVFPSGRLYHMADWATIRYLVGGVQNVHTLGLLFHGTFMGVNPGDLQIEAGQSFIANARMQLGNAALSVLGHQDISSTACPGDGWDTWKHRLTGDTKPVDTRSDLHIQLDTLYGLIGQVPDEPLRAQMFAALFAAKDEAGI